ncbi:hypothetical protein TL16_g01586 [Triparma laevis f. inornata]|uniref:Uncharacterized protein n=1 Tax=Triparma laevis f. inornata TaxID=1714386 RepID=A0A9W6ZKS1_9STRA|nr:hypothetical protein TL16_g01586 [Triparma laevis f. inornata]
MKSSQSPSEPAALTNPPSSCAVTGCKVPTTKTCSRCKEIQYCSKEHQTEHWKFHKKLCVAPEKKISAPVPPAPLVHLKGSVNEEEIYKDNCFICLVNVPDAQLHPCGHSMICRVCTQALVTRSEPCPICRKPISSFDVGVYSDSLGTRGLWPTSYKNLRQLASGEGFNEYFRKQFNGNEATFLKWKEFFDVLEIVGGRGCHHNVRVHLETQVLTITRSEHLVKLRALAELCSREFCDDPSLLVVAWRRILEVLELAMPEEKKVRGKKKQQQKKKKNDPRKLEILDACFALGVACGWVEDFEDARRYCKRAKEGYEEQLGRDSEKALKVTIGLIMVTCSSNEEKIEKLRDLVKRCEKAFGEEHVVTLDTLDSLGCMLRGNGEDEEAKEVYERCLAGRIKLLGEDHKLSLDSLNNLGAVYDGLKDYEKALEYYEKALKGSERLLGKNHPNALDTVVNMANIYSGRFHDFVKATEFYERALEGFEAQLGKDHDNTKMRAMNFSNFLKVSRNEERLESLKIAYPWLSDDEAIRLFRESLP